MLLQTQTVLHDFSLSFPKNSTFIKVQDKEVIVFLFFLWVRLMCALKD